MTEKAHSPMTQYRRERDEARAALKAKSEEVERLNALVGTWQTEEDGWVKKFRTLEDTISRLRDKPQTLLEAHRDIDRLQTRLGAALTRAEKAETELERLRALLKTQAGDDTAESEGGS